jgi:hypothetical protein
MFINFIGRIKIHVGKSSLFVRLPVLINQRIRTRNRDEQLYLPLPRGLQVKIDILNLDSPLAEESLGFSRGGTLFSTVYLNHDGIVDDEGASVLLLLMIHGRKHGENPRPRGA